MRVLEVARDRAHVHRPREQEALTQLAAQIAERHHLPVELDALGHNLEAQRPAQRDHRGRQPVVGPGLGVEERAIHLQDVDREAAEVAERGVAGAEVVHRQPHTQRLHLFEAADRHLGVAHHQALGDLDDQRPRIDAAVRDRPADVADDVALVELARRQVDAHRQRRIVGEHAL